MQIRKFFKLFGIAIALLTGVTVVGGQIANSLVPLIEPPGDLYVVNGAEMHLYCTGPEDSHLPTVIIIPGLGVQSPLYYDMQKELSKSVRTCTYDRAGNGWSQPSQLPGHVKNMSDDLNQLLDHANIEGPLVLAGHSLGGAVSLVYSAEHHDRVSGLAFIDSSHYNQYAYFGKQYSDEIYHKQKELASAFWVEETLVRSGLLTLVGYLAGGSSSEIDDDMQKMYLYFFVHNPPFDSIRSEVENLEYSLEQTKQSHYHRGNLPIVSMSASEMDFTNMPKTNMTENERKNIHLLFGRELADLSSQGKHVVINGTDHIDIIQNNETSKQILNLISLTGEKQNED